jgi:DNA-binding NarL/FixJ family response regulator
MTEGPDKKTRQEGARKVGSLLKKIDLHMKDLELVGEEIQKVGSLISEAARRTGPKAETENLREAARRLEQRLGKWIGQLAEEYEAIKRAVLANGSAEGHEEAPLAMPVDDHKVFLIDNRVLVRKALRTMVDDKPGYRVIGEADDLKGATASLQALKPDLLVTHVCPEEPDQLDMPGVLKKAFPDFKVLVLTERGDGKFFARLVRSGADAYLLDDTAEQMLFFALERVLKGERYVSPRISESLLDQPREDKSETGPPILTGREREILNLVAAGKSSGAIGKQLFISTKTVNRHRANIAAKLNIKKTVELVKYAISRGLVSSD